MQDRDFESMTEEDLMRKVEEVIHFKWKNLPATQKQKSKLRKLGIVFEKDLSKSRAFFLIRHRVNGIRLPNDFV